MLMVEKIVLGFIFSVLIISAGIIKFQMNTIEDLQKELSNKDNAIIKEIEVCNNSKEIAAYKSQFEEYKELFDANVRAANNAIKQKELLQRELSDIEDELMIYREKDIKCLNTEVDKEYLSRLKEVVNNVKK